MKKNPNNNQKLIKIQLAESSLYEFTKQAWDIIEPAEQFIDNWHIELLCDTLQALIEGKLTNKRLLINMPPRHMKSIVVSVMLPCWRWINRPGERFLCGSSNIELSTRDSLKCRDIISSDWYQERWRKNYQLSGDQNAKKVFKNTVQGERRACSVGSKVTGQGGSVLIADDLNDMNEIFQEAARNSVLHFWNQVFSNRENQRGKSIKICMQQRGHDLDVAGDILSKMGDIPYNLLILKSIATEDEEWKSPLTGKILHTRKKGDLLWPARFPQDILDEDLILLGKQGFEAQHQQSPVIHGGRIWKIEDFKYLKDLPSRAIQIVQSWDTAFKTEEENDYSVCSTWIEFVSGFQLIDIWRGKVEYPELEKMAEYLMKKHKATKILIEDKASGQSLIQVLKRKFGNRIKPINPMGDKVARASAVSSAIAGGLVWLLTDQGWIEDFFYEIERFPNGIHDDQVDSVSQALIFLLKLDRKRSPQLRSF